MMRYLLRFNWPLALCAAALTVLGVVFIGSAGAARSVVALQTAWRSHAVTAIGGFALMFALAAQGIGGPGHGRKHDQRAAFFPDQAGDGLDPGG